MKLLVCSLDDVGEVARRRRPDAVVGLLSEHQIPPPIEGDPPRLLLRFHDIAAPCEGLIAPDIGTVGRLIEFAADKGPTATLLLHCWMGISRSPAAAFILACAAAASTPEEEIALALRRAAPAATPNPLLVSLADDHLGRSGRMVAAVARIGRGRPSARGEPFELDTALLRARPEGAP